MENDLREIRTGVNELLEHYLSAFGCSVSNFAVDASQLKSLSEGSYGKVYSHGNYVVKRISYVHLLKMYRFRGDRARHIIETLSNELKHLALATVEISENICPIICVQQQQDYLEIVMQACGEEMFTLLSKIDASFAEAKKFNMKSWLYPTYGQIMSWFRSLASVLRRLQENGLYHLDIKPENILLQDFTSDSGISIIDFGLSQNITMFEKNGRSVGTETYMAPEIEFTTPPYDKADVYSMGSTLQIFLDYAPDDLRPKLGYLVRNLTEKEYKKRWTLLQAEQAFAKELAAFKSMRKSK
jgi:serine/threonine protein kinase